MKEEIGFTAGKTWEVLRNKGEVELTKLPRMLDESAAVVYQAVGWLAREDKIKYSKKGGKVFVSLT